MSYDDFSYTDDEKALLRKVKTAVREAGEKTVEELKELNRTAGRGLEYDARLLEAFNRMTTAIEGLSGEIRSLREDLSPSLEKPKKLPGLGTGS